VVAPFACSSIMFSDKPKSRATREGRIPLFRSGFCGDLVAMFNRRTLVSGDITKHKTGDRCVERQACVHNDVEDERKYLLHDVLAADEAQRVRPAMNTVKSKRLTPRSPGSKLFILDQ
jgi:hypothetical protein